MYFTYIFFNFLCLFFKMHRLPNYTFTEYLLKIRQNAPTEEPFDITDYLERKPATEESPTLSYILDYRTGKYYHFSKHVKQLTGFDKEVFLSEGFVFTVQQYNQQDAEICFNTILPKYLHFFRKLDENSYRDYSFQYNFRFQHREQHFITILQESKVLKGDKNGPLVMLGFWTDITPFKEDNRITAVIKYTRFGESQQVIEIDHYSPRSGEGILSVRELQILKMVLEGHNSEAIAQKLHISKHTVLTHRARIREKTNAKNVADLLRYATENKIL